LFAERRGIYQKNGMRRVRQFNIDRLPDDARAEVLRIEDEITRVSAEMGIAPENALKETAVSTANAADLFDEQGQRIGGDEPGQAALTLEQPTIPEPRKPAVTAQGMDLGGASRPVMR